MSENNESQNYYEQRGYVRHMIIVPKSHKEKLKKIAKHYSITQGEVIEVMLDQIDMARMSAHFEAKRGEKVGNRGTSKTELAKKLKDLTPEQIAAIEAIIAQGV